MSTQKIPETPPEYDHTRIIERPDGFYWVDKDTNTEYGPFETLIAAVEDVEYRADSDYEPAESCTKQKRRSGFRIGLIRGSSPSRLQSGGRRS